MSLTIVRFQVVPFSSRYVPEEEAYTLFGQSTDAADLTRALYALLRHEQENLEGNINTRSNRLLREQCQVNSDELPLSSHHTSIITNGHRHDGILQQQNLNTLTDRPYVLVLLENDEYVGHCYLWTVDVGSQYVTNIMGMRPSVAYVRSRQCRGLLPPSNAPFLNAIFDMSEFLPLDKPHTLRVLQPHPTQVSELIQYGFIRHKTYNKLNDNSTLGENNLSSVLLLREQDYTRPLM